MNTQPTRRIEKRSREVSNRYSPNVKIKNSDVDSLEKKSLAALHIMKIVSDSISL